MELLSQVEDLPHLDERKNQSLQEFLLPTLQRMEPKMFGTREEYGVNTPHVLSMRSYAHTLEKHAKMTFLSKHAKLPL